MQLSDEYKKKLEGYTYVKDPNELEIGDYVKYIRISDGKLVHGGKLTEMMKDKNDDKKIYKIKLKNSYGGEWFIKTDGITLFHKKTTVVEQRQQKWNEWKKNLTPYELRKWRTMKKEENGSKKFLEWYQNRKNK